MEDQSSGLERGKWLENKVEQVRYIAYDIEDVLDEFVLHSPPYTFHNRHFIRQIHTVAHTVYHGFPIRGISEKIARIKKSIDDMGSQHAFLSTGLSSPGPSSSSTNRIRPHPPVSPLLLDDEIVGYEKEKKIFTDQLVDGEKRLVALAVAGPAGSGKTAFVKNIFCKRGIMGRFDCHAWVRVSQHFEAEELFVNMLKQFCYSRKESYPIDDGTNTQTKLHKYLTGKRFIVVLDDIWSQNHWDVIKGGFPDAFRGSRIIVTTRSSDVASVCASSSTHVHILNCLGWLHALTLFYRKAFQDIDGQCPPELKGCSERIVKRCEGLPLAIVAVGSALAHKPRLPNEWEKFHNSLGCEITEDSNLSVISNALLPGYMDLSTNLKSCFLYFSIFPEDYSVERGRLIRLWVAEQFAVGINFQTAEEVAEGYLDELIQRNLVHVSNYDFDGTPRNCRVLNPVLNFVTHKCKYENFASIFPTENTSRNQKIRRLSVRNDCTHLPRNIDFSGVRSMFLLSLVETSTSNFEKVLRELKLTRVLDFQGAPITKFPEDITHLTLLRHLNFRGTKIKSIPSSIKKLSYLETLDLKQTDVKELPKEICHLHNLRHLLAYKHNVESYVVFESVQGVKIHKGIGKLTELQALSLVKVGKKFKILEELKLLTKLRKLGLTGIRRGYGNELSASVEQMPLLTTLDLCSDTKEEFLELGEMRNPPSKLQRLYLKGRVNQLPTWISSLDNLLRIGLKWSKMQCSPLQALQRLPNLMELELVDCYIGGELIFEASSFKKLKILLIEDLAELHTIVIRNGAMPDLKQISLHKCPRMTISPLGMNNLAKVEELILRDMAQEFIARLRMNGEDRAMVARIPLINSFTSGHQHSWSFENLSDSSSH
ncbi:hypothetical protein ABFS82_13G154200 [Erythranthe guttata]|uniref:Uncharacterized protein n=1 Tax=Erythranthe guttata TaxID=4155 RepID=A0A022QFM3_ERYGU|nr:hypothetical protein MIMGU_mgv1a001142mg [Erythranthe guttata]